MSAPKRREQGLEPQLVQEQEQGRALVQVLAQKLVRVLPQERRREQEQRLRRRRRQ